MVLLSEMGRWISKNMTPKHKVVVAVCRFAEGVLTYLLHGLFVHRQVDGKVQAGLTPTSDVQERKKKKKEASCLARAGLSSYLYRLCITCINLSMLGVVSTPPQYSIGKSTHHYSITGNSLIRQVYTQAVQAGRVTPGQGSRPGRPAC
jgi:hypothetical protein